MQHKMEGSSGRSCLLCVVPVVVLMVVSTASAQFPCSGKEPGWFGDKCQFQCHCWNFADCDVNGDCPNSRCANGWFGPQCQYKDIAYETNHSLTDGDDTTCLLGADVEQVVELITHVRFTWMRIVTNKPGVFDDVTLTFKKSDDAQVFQAVTRELTKIFLSDTMVDIHLNLPERIRKIEMTFRDVEQRQSFCSVYVSGGRNVALRQDTEQSSTFPGSGPWPPGDSYKAVDGNTEPDYQRRSCTATGYARDPSYWRLTLSQPAIVDRLKLYNRLRTASRCRLQHFKLQTYGTSGLIQEHDDQSSVGQATYDVLTNSLSPVESVNISVGTAYRDDWDSCNSPRPVLNLCEVEVFGDSSCVEGKWGRQCENNCVNCEDPTETCYVSTGMCPSGCKAGYHGVGCAQECTPGQWGKDCLNDCDNHCRDGVCDRINGQCTHGCDKGYKLPDCVEECDPGFHGYKCSFKCSANCKMDNNCDRVNGFCDRGCKPGYKGLACDQECTDTYYGESCASRCDTTCVDQLCHHVSGRCDDCPAGKQGNTKCDQDCEDGFYGPRCDDPCGEGCSNGDVCDKKNGACPNGCIDGYLSELCDELCQHGFYGPSCRRACSADCVVDNTKHPAICEPQTGLCLSGCAPNAAPTCKAKYAEDSDEETKIDLKLSIILALACCLAIALVTLVVAVIYHLRTRKRPPKDTNHVNPTFQDPAPHYEPMQGQEAKPRSDGEYVNCDSSPGENIYSEAADS